MNRFNPDDIKIAELEKKIADLTRRMNEVRESPAFSDVDTTEALRSLMEKRTDAELDLELLHAHKGK